MCTKKVVLASLLLLPGATLGADAPRDVVAAPEVYKEVSGNADFRVVEATWKPGQRDAMHSHGAQLYYWVTPCNLRQHFPDGSKKDFTNYAGQAGQAEAIPAHLVENIGKAACKVVIFEPR